MSLNQETENLVPFKLNDVPGLMVIAGSNGSGKTALLNLLFTVSERRPRPGLEIPDSAKLRDKVKYVRVGHVPGDIAKESEHARVQSEQRTKKFLDYLRDGNWRNEQFNKLARDFLKKIDPTIADWDAAASERIRGLSEREILDQLPSDFSLFLQNFENNEFIAEVCLTYSERLNAEKIKLFDAGKQKSVGEIEALIGKSPWARVNELFEKYDFSFRLTAPEVGVQYVPQFVNDNMPENRINFSNLSSGEKIVVTLVLWAFNSAQKNHRSVLLLDEFDAHLNPALAKMMMEIISDTLVHEHGLQVFLTTHSPSTVAFTPEGSLFWMERGSPIRPATKQEVIPRLSDGFFAVQEESAVGLVGLVVEQDPRPVLFVEGKTDKEILNVAWQKIYGETELPFHIQDAFDCYFINNMFARGDIFNNYPDQKFLALLDFDDAFKKAKETSKRKKWKRKEFAEPHQVTFTLPNENGVMLTLPVPSFRATYAGLNISNSYLSIELLFSDEIVAEFCKEEAVAGGALIKKFKDAKKTQFSQKASDFPEEEFDQFKPLFERLIELL